MCKTVARARQLVPAKQRIKAMSEEEKISTSRWSLPQVTEQTKKQQANSMKQRNEVHQVKRVQTCYRQINSTNDPF